MNNFAVSSDGIATALQDSASALMEAGNNLEQSVALVAAANKVVQDPNSVGSALRTISLRLRGTSVEILEEMGEETEGVVESTSKLQEKVKALSGVNILDDTGAYKDTYTILKEIGIVWEEMSDIDQAALLELLAGKNRANTLSAILSNMKDLEGAYESALNAEGSALKENETYLDSIQGRIDLFNNSLQTMWMNLINSEVVKNIVNAGSALINFIDAAGAIPTAVGGFALVKSSIKAISAELEAVKKGTSQFSGMFAKAAKEGAAAAQEESNVIKYNFKTKQKVTEATKASVIARKMENAAQKEHIAGNTQEIVSDSLETKGTWKQVAAEKALAVAKGLGKGFLIGLASFAISSIITKLINSISDASREMEELTQHAIDSAKELNSARDSIEDYKEEIQDLRDALADNTISEQEAYDARARLMDIQNELIDRFGLEAKGLNLVTGEINKQKEAIDALARASAQDWLKENSEAYSSAKDTITQKHSTDFEIYKRTSTSSLWGDPNVKHTLFGLKGYGKPLLNENDNIREQYMSGLINVIESAGGQVSELNDIDRNTGVTQETFTQTATFTGKTAEELNAIFDAMQTYMLEFANNYDGLDFSEEIARLQSFKDNYINEDYKKAREVYNAGRQQEAISNYATEYDAILDAEEDIYRSTSDEDRLAAIKKYNDEIQKAQNKRTDDAHMDEYFGDLIEKFKKQEFELNIKLNEDGLKSNLENIISEGGEKGISALDDAALQDMVIRGLNVEGATNVSGKYTQEQVNGLILLQAEADKAGISIEGLIDILTNLGLIAGRPVENSAESVKFVAKTYSTLVESAEAYNEILSQTSEIATDNTEITQEYKDSLTGLGISQEELNECFDDANPLIVKNAKALNKLVKEANKNVAANVKLAKSNARLEYYQLVKQLGDTLKNTTKLDDATRDYVNTTLDQIDLVEDAIYKYQLLEDSLLGATNAFTDFAKAQEVDDLNTYGTSYVEMVQTLYDGLYKTGQVGTEQFKAAAEALIPDDVYQGLVDEHERMEAMLKYFNKNIAPTLTLDEDEFKFDYKGIENFVEKAREAKVLIGDDNESFDLAENMNLEEAARLIGMTTTQAYAFFAELDKYNTGSEQSFLSQLDDSLEGKISNITTELQELNKQKLVFLEDKTEIAEELEELGKGGTVDLTLRPVINSQELIDAGWDTQAGQIATVFTSTFSNELGNIAINFTPIVVDELGNRIDVLGPEELQRYAENVIAGVHGDYLNLQIGAKFEGEDAIEQAEVAAEHIHNLHEDYVGLNKTISDINADIASNNTELQNAGKSAYDMWQAYTKNEAAIAAIELISDKQRLLTKNEANTFGIKWDEVQGLTVQQTIDHLLEKKLKLEEPTVLTAQLSIEYINTQIAELESKINKIKHDSTISPEVKQAKTDELDEQIRKLEQDKVTIATTFGIELSDEEKEDLLEYLNDIEEITIGDKKFKVVASGVSETMRALQKLRDYALGNIEVKAGIGGSGGGSGKKLTYTYVANADGTAHAKGSWGTPKTETALVGELGPEILVRNGKWATVGDNGAEFTQVKKGDIIFNHKQTEDLLSKGYVTGRGRLQGGAFASGTAYAGLWKPLSPDKELSNKAGRDFSYAASNLDNAAGSISDAADEFREVFDWIEVRLEEINEDIDFRSAKLENTIGFNNQNSIIDEIINLNQKLYDNLIAGANRYYAYSEKLLEKVPSEYREAAQNGAIALEEFVGEVDEKTLEAIQEYRDWVQKGADATQQAEEALTEISNLAKQAIDNIAAQFDNEASLRENKADQLDAYNALLETTYGAESEEIYKALIQINKDNISELEKQRDAMQEELNKQVENGNIEKYSQDWYDAVNDIAELDTEIIELKTDINDLQDSINELHWQHFDLLMSQIDAVSEEAENLIDILQTKDVVDEVGNWTDEGITALGLYAQQMEVAEVQAAKYAEEIEYLNENWQELGYTEEEYLDKLDELKSGQYDAIKAYNDSKDAIVDLNKERIDAIKNGIEKEIEAYEELIDKKKEELDAEQDLYDFQKKVRQSAKDIADIERQLAALSADNSASARAKRAQLEAELAEVRQEQEDMYYERSISNQQEALDKELENFKEEKDAEIEGWEEYLEDTEKVVADSLLTVQNNTDAVLQTLNTLGQEYSLSITSSLTSPWENGSIAIQNYSEQFKLSMSSTVEELEKLSAEYDKLMEKIDVAGDQSSIAVDTNSSSYQEATKQEEPSDAPSTPSDNSGNTSYNAGLVSSISGTIYRGQKGDNVKKLQQALNDLGYGNSGTSDLDGSFGPKTEDAVKEFQKAMGIAVDGRVGPETKKKFETKGYAKGSTGINENQLAIIDELGEELLVRVHNGRLTYLEKGSGVVPADLTENLMGWGKLDPSIMLDQNRPQIGMHPEIHNTQIQIDNSIAELIHIDHCDQNTLPDVKKIVDEALEKHTQKLNNSLRKYTR